MKELVKFGMRIGIVGHFEQRQEDVVKYLLEVRHEFVKFEDVAKKVDTKINNKLQSSFLP